LVNVVSDADIFDFQWPKSVAGYELREPKIQRGGATARMLLDSGPLVSRRGTEMNTYPPRAVPDLHRKFAALGDTPAEILEFVRAYGFLGLGSQGRDAESESVREIVAARDHMREVLDVFDGLVGLEAKAKRTVKEMKEEGRKVINEARVNAFRQLAGGLFNQWAAPRLVLRLRPAEHGLALRVEPQNLLSSMWLQVAEELTGGAKYRHCEWCRRPIPIGKGGGRIDRKTCSDACRQALSTAQKPLKKTTKKSKQAKRGSK